MKISKLKAEKALQNTFEHSLNQSTHSIDPFED